MNTRVLMLACLNHRRGASVPLSQGQILSPLPSAGIGQLQFSPTQLTGQVMPPPPPPHAVQYPPSQMEQYQHLFNSFLTFMQASGGKCS